MENTPLIESNPLTNLDQSKKEDHINSPKEEESKQPEVINSISALSINNIPEENKLDGTENVTYEVELDKKIQKIQGLTIDYFDTITSELKTKYLSLKERILAKLNARSNKLLRNKSSDDKSLSSGTSKFIKNYIEKYLNRTLGDFFEIHDNLLENIKNNIDILNTYLNIDEYLDQEDPIKEYLNQNFDKIYNSWLFLNIDFSKYNFNDILFNKKIPENIKELLIKKNSNKVFTEMIIEESDKLKNNKEDLELYRRNVYDLLNDNIGNLTYLQMKNITNIYDLYLKNVKFQKMNKLEIINSHITANINFKETFPTLNTLKIRNCPVIDNICISTFLNIKLKKISFEKNNLTENEFHILMQSLSLQNEIRQNLERLSFANNNITKVNLSHYMSQRLKYSELREINFKKNKIYQFTRASPEYCPNLKVINLSYNHLARNFFPKKKDEHILILTNNNIYLSCKNLNSEYLKYLTNELPETEYPYEEFSLSGLFNKFNMQNILEFRINEKSQLGIRILDLSFCSLTNETLFQFLNNNLALLKIRKLILHNNLINDEFFDFFINNELYVSYAYLTSVNLSSNDIKGTNFKSIAEFIRKNKFLAKLNLCKNPFCKDYIHKSYSKSLDSSINNSYNSGSNSFVREDSLAECEEDFKDYKYDDINDLGGLFKYAKYLDSEYGRAVRNYNKKTKGFKLKFDTYKKFNMDNTQLKYIVEKKDKTKTITPVLAVKK